MKLEGPAVCVATADVVCQERMIRFAVAILVGFVAFFVTLPVTRQVFHSTMNHTWANAYTELKRLHRGLAEYEQFSGELPDPDRINQEIAKAWAEDFRSYDSAETPEDIYFAPIFRFAVWSHLQVWDKPPKFTETSSSDNGFGFYLEGDDSVSNTQGNDPDDINSWDSDSISFYYDRLRRRKDTLESGAALCIALPAALLVYRRGPNRDQQKKAQQAEEADAGNA